MGVGDPLEASYALSGLLRAGTWHFIGDGVVLAPVDVRFDLVWRAATDDRVIVTFPHHFTPAKGYEASPFEADTNGAIPARAGDLFVLRMTASSSIAGAAYVPNADGPHTNGRIPSITLP